MVAFRVVEPQSLGEATAALANADAKALAGGTDILAEIRDGLHSPRTLVSLADVAELRGIERTDAGWRIGAAATLAEIIAAPGLAGEFPLVAQAAASVATPQVRNLATLGGNLCQRPRCWYYRLPEFFCYKKGGDHCFALRGYNRNLAIFGRAPCVMAHPSDMAPALMAAVARAEIAGPNGARSVALDDLFVAPSVSQLSEVALGPEEIITAITIPHPRDETRSMFLKAQDRSGEDFALASVAAMLSLRDGAATRAGLVLGGVAPTPRRCREVEEYLVGRPASDVDARRAAELAVEGARPLSQNGFKVDLTRNLVRHAIETLLAN